MINTRHDYSKNKPQKETQQIKEQHGKQEVFKSGPSVCFLPPHDQQRRSFII